MQPRTIALYVTDTMPDWEYAYLTTQVADAEQVRPGRFSLALVGDGTAVVRSLGGLPVQPTHDLADLAEDEALAALVVPGGSGYGTGHERLVALVERLLARGVPVAAICGGTSLLARAGVLDERRHTSNDAAYLAMTGYAGGARYVDAPVVTDRGVTTAGSVHPVPFTAEVVRLTGLCPESVVAPWELLHTTGDPRHFYELMAATEAWRAA